MSTTTLPGTLPVVTIINSRRRYNGRLAAARRIGSVIDFFELEARDYEEARAEAQALLGDLVRVIVPALGES